MKWFKDYALAPLAALIAVIALAWGVSMVVNEGDKPRSLAGTWQAQVNENATMTAKIYQGKIEISWSSPDATALYWKGTFPTDEVVAAGYQVTSMADKDALSRSILGSTADEKVFTYDHGTIQFYFSAFGVTRIISLEK